MRSRRKYDDVRNATRQEIYEELVKPKTKKGQDPDDFPHTMDTKQDFEAPTLSYDSVRNTSLRYCNFRLEDMCSRPSFHVT